MPGLELPETILGFSTNMVLAAILVIVLIYVGYLSFGTFTLLQAKNKRLIAGGGAGIRIGAAEGMRNKPKMTPINDTRVPKQLGITSEMPDYYVNQGS